jgi:hypothetical protein
MDHGRDAESVGRGEDQVTIFGEGIHTVSDGMELNADELQIPDAALYFALIAVMIAMRAEASQSEEATGIFRT